MSEPEKQPPDIEIEADVIDLRAQIAAARKAISESAVRFVRRTGDH